MPKQFVKDVRQWDMFDVEPPFPAPIVCFANKALTKQQGWEISVREAVESQRKSDAEISRIRPEPKTLDRHGRLRKQLFEGNLQIGKTRWIQARSRKRPLICTKKAVWLTEREAVEFLDSPDARHLQKLSDLHWVFLPN